MDKLLEEYIVKNNLYDEKQTVFLKYSLPHKDADNLKDLLSNLNYDEARIFPVYYGIMKMITSKSDYKAQLDGKVVAEPLY